jgi:hypothetical protein
MNDSDVFFSFSNCQYITKDDQCDNFDDGSDKTCQKCSKVFCRDHYESHPCIDLHKTSTFRKVTTQRNIAPIAAINIFASPPH